MSKYLWRAGDLYRWCLFRKSWPWRLGVGNGARRRTLRDGRRISHNEPADGNFGSVARDQGAHCDGGTD